MPLLYSVVLCWSQNQRKREQGRQGAEAEAIGACAGCEWSRDCRAVNGRGEYLWGGNKSPLHTRQCEKITDSWYA